MNVTSKMSDKLKEESNNKLIDLSKKIHNISKKN